jgi:oligopeptide/dipeptide ABC transporter ATP-binding protein
MAKTQLLKVEDLSVVFPTTKGTMRALDGVSFPIYENEILGLVGESGSGKTVTALSILQLLGPAARVESGQVWFKGKDLLLLGERNMGQIRGTQISMIFQSPRSALNPLKQVGIQTANVFHLHHGLSRRECQIRALTLLKRVGFPGATRQIRSYPHQLSTGMCQRVMIAMMIASQPDLLIADEPTTALDVTIGAQIYDLLHEIRAETRMSILLITHDLGLVAENCQRVAVMHAGHIVEMGRVETIFEDPRHPYTSLLLHHLLRVDRDVELPSSRGVTVEERDYAAVGCRYARKCIIGEAVCFEKKPERVKVGPDHWVRCHLATPRRLRSR